MRIKFSQKLNIQNIHQTISLSQILDVQDPPPSGNCVNTKVYIADVTGFGLIVYDSVTNRSWRVQNKLVNANSLFCTSILLTTQFTILSSILSQTMVRTPLLVSRLT